MYSSIGEGRPSDAGGPRFDSQCPLLVVGIVVVVVLLLVVVVVVIAVAIGISYYLVASC